MAGNLFTKYLQRGEGSLREKFDSYLWLIWRWRNEAVFTGKATTGWEKMSIAKRFVGEVNLVLSKRSTTSWDETKTNESFNG